MTKKTALIASAALSLAAFAEGWDVAAYVWPAYQPEPRWQELGIFSDGIGEWQNVKECKPSWKGHLQPRVPLWGYGNEADPAEVSRKIDAAVSHGVNVFIYDWYWYGGRPFLEDGLDKGFLGAPNNTDMKFFIMWANHHVTPLWDNRVTGRDKGRRIWPGTIDAAEFAKISERWIAKYFKRPNYYRIGGKPVLMIYELHTFISGLGGEDKAREALDGFRRRCEDAGLGGVHVMACDWQLRKSTVARLGIDSATIYNFVHWANPGKYHEYSDWAAKGCERFDQAKDLGLKAYFPHASVGWDTNPRFPANAKRPTVFNGTPEKFAAAMRRAREWGEKNIPEGFPKLITINSWNEWTEGSYLEPDTHFGYGYLDAVRSVFGSGMSRDAGAAPSASGQRR